MRTSILIAILVLSTSPAFGQRSPFVASDRLDGHTGADLDLGVTIAPDVEDTVGTRIDLGFQSFWRGDMGAYFQLPLTAVLADQSWFAVGNLELGGAMTMRLGPGRLLFRLGVAFGTATEDEDVAVANSFNAHGRISDVALSTPGTTSPRASVSTFGARGVWLYRVDAGIDVPVHSGTRVDPATLLRFNLGAGLEADDNTIVMAELSNVVPLSDSASTMSSFALSARRTSGLMAGISIPLTNDLLGKIYTFRIGYDFGGGALAKQRRRLAAREKADCAPLLAAWRSERDLARKSAAFEDLPEHCKAEATAQP